MLYDHIMQQLLWSNFSSNTSKFIRVLMAMDAEHGVWFLTSTFFSGTTPKNNNPDNVCGEHGGQFCLMLYYSFFSSLKP